MNDISVKIEELPKSPKEVAGSPSTLTGTENVFDPLAIDDEVEAVKDPVDEKKPVEEKAGSCDDDAKEKINEKQNGEANEVISLETEIIKGKSETTVLAQYLNLVTAPVGYVLKTIKLPEEVKETGSLEVATEVPQVNDEIDEPVLEQSAENPEIPEVSTIKADEGKPESPVVAPIPDQEKVIERIPSPIKVVVKEEVKSQEEQDQEMTDDEQGTKRRSCEEVETESPLKKLCQEVEKTFPQHDGMINDYIQTATKNNIDEVQMHTEQLLSEIQTLRELAQKKEHEWNSILHLKKVKEEILLRLLRKKQVLSFEKSPEVNGQDPFDYMNQAKNLAIDKSDDISGLAIKQPGPTVNPMMQPPMMPMSPYNPMSGLPPPYDKAHLQNMPKPVFPQQLMCPGPMQGFPRDMNGQLPGYGLPMGRQGPTKDVKSIIADYRQRNPDITPRRGRRMKSILNPNMMNAPRPIAPKMDTMLERLQQVQGSGMQNGMSFKDVLVQFANMQQNNPGLIPNRVENIPIRPEQHIRPDNRLDNRLDNRRRPERSHEEQAPRRATRSSRTRFCMEYLLSLNECCHLQQASPAPQSFSPTLAKLLTSPERKGTSLPTFGQAKNCGEITITPVQPTSQPPEPQPVKTEEVVQLASGSPSGSGTGRLVIDEGGTEGNEGGDGDSGDTPLCQGCKRKNAQFVCAGCANQWYCSRDCQVAAWDDHSEMCS
ncbi:putative tigger transposable element derived 6-like protein, partial [Operophtera brumata]